MVLVCVGCVADSPNPVAPNLGAPLSGSYTQTICSYEFRHIAADGRYVSVVVPTALVEEGVQSLAISRASLRSGPYGCFEGQNDVVPGSTVTIGGPVVLDTKFGDDDAESTLCVGDTVVVIDNNTVGEFLDLCISGTEFTVALD